MSDVVERMNGGAVKDDKSPENEAIDLRKTVQLPLFWAVTPPPLHSLEDMSEELWVVCLVFLQI